MATIGKNILENLTTGMYSDSKVSFREYVQNSCDQIDIAVKEGLISNEDALIDIFIDPRKRYISIKDNATGVSSDSFVQTLGDIANSDKKIGSNKGFRGIGRLCGLAYCKTLKFSTTFKGEDIVSIMICDAEKMRRMLIEDKKYTIDDILAEIIKYDSKPAHSDEHFFEVELIEITQSNTDLLDAKKVKEYLSFVAPVPYKNTFTLRNQIYEHASSIKCSIDEYTVNIDGCQIFKEYTTKLKEQSGNNLKNYDEISKLEFKDFYSTEGKLLAWMWVGLSRFEKQIPKTNNMRGLRMRQSNIQIGDSNVLQSMFKESRGNYYFVGEVFAINKALVPNSQRDYFNENIARVELEDALRAYFYDVLHKLYYDANKIKNAYRKQEDLLNKKNVFEEKSRSNTFVDEIEKQKLQFEITKAKEEVETASKQLEKFVGGSINMPINEVYKSIGRKFNSEELTKKIETVSLELQEFESEEQDSKTGGYIANSLSKLSRNERKLVRKIMSIITVAAPKEIAEELIKKIQEELK